MQIEWSETKIKLKDLKEYKNNPRLIKNDQFDRLVKSLKENGYNNRILCDDDNTIIGGHMRKKAFKEAGFQEDDTINVLKPNRPLTEEEFKRINIQDNVSFGEWDVDALANNFEIEDLIEWGIPDDLFPQGLTLPELENSEKEKDQKINTCPNCGFEYQ